MKETCTQQTGWGRYVGTHTVAVVVAVLSVPVVARAFFFEVVCCLLRQWSTRMERLLCKNTVERI